MACIRVARPGKRLWAELSGLLQELQGQPIDVLWLDLPTHSPGVDYAAERALLTFPVLLLIVVELLNSAVEVTVDRIGVDHHPLSGLAKDVASAAVLLSIYLVLFGWALVLYDRYG